MGAGHATADSEPTTGPKVLRVSPKNPKVRTIEVVRPLAKDATFLEATMTGLGITFKHFIRNANPFKKRRSGDVLSKGGVPTASTPGQDWIDTFEYPEEKPKYPERNRGLHRLMLREDGAVRCVACMCCPTVCPANCITIVPEESDSNSTEKRPAIFEIDELRCVVCGLCVEACPCDAIRMDTGMHAKPVELRSAAIENKDSMMGRGIPSLAVQGGEGAAWRGKK